MADYGVNLYGNAIIVNPKFAADHPDAVKGFLRAFLKGLEEDRARRRRPPSASCSSAPIRRSKNLELDRLKMVIRENIVTPEVKANGYGGIDGERFARAIDQLAQTYKFKAKPKPDDIFDASFLPAEAERKLPRGQATGVRD